MRLFVSLRPSTQAVTHLRAAVGRRRSAPPERWHVTLAFLGEVDDDVPLVEPLRAAAAGHAPFDLRLAGSGASGGAHVWAGVAGDVPALRALQADVARAVTSAGVVLERREYRPHLTLGRRRALDPAVLQGYEGPAWTVSEVELVQSVLHPTVVHTVRERLPLRP